MDVILARVSEVEGDVFVRRQRSEDAASVQDRLRKRSSKSATNNVVKESRDVMNADAAKNLRLNLNKKRSSPEPEESADVKRAKTGDTHSDNTTLNTFHDSTRSNAEGVDRIADNGLLPDPGTESLPAGEGVGPGKEVEEEDAEEDMVLLDEDVEALGLDAVVLGMKIEEVENAREEIKRRLKQKQEKVIETNKVVVKDNVRFHELGYKDRYYGDSYKRKDLAVGGGLDRMCETYVQGLCWVLQYYYQGW